MPSNIEAALGRHRLWSIAALLLLTVLAWAWLIGGAGMGMDPFASLTPPPAQMPAMPDMSMPGMAMPPTTAAKASAWPLSRVLLTFSMWWTMMIAMMLPSAAPTILLFARTAAHGNPEVPPASASFLAGYLAAWGAFSLLATILHAILDHAGLIDAMRMSSQDRWLSATVLIAAGLYQLTPIKDVCLRHCRNPAQFLSRNYRPGHIGALRMGLHHGTICIGCCWLLMALLFVGGVMNLAWIALLTLMVAAEKLFPHGRTISLIAGLVCLAWGAAILFR
jgi:predicted metal-binding membrane protein